MLSKTSLLALLFVTLPACGQVAAPPPSPAPPKDPATHLATCTELVNAYATWQTGCLGAALSAARVDDLIVHCSARAALPGVTAKAEAFHACAQKIPDASCAGVPLECLSPIGNLDNAAQSNSIWLGSGVSDLYYDLFPRAAGSRAAGAFCSIAAQCKSGACTSQDSCGICVDQSAAGQACSATALCVEYRDQCVNGVCVETGLAEGSPCQDAKGDSNCLSSLYCLNGTCAPRHKVGEACTDYPPVCPLDAVCQASVCVKVEAVTEGQACDFGAARCTGEGLFCVGGVCRKPIANVGVGADCSYDSCAPGLQCVSSTCAVPAKAGEPCPTSDACAAGLTCLNNSGGSGVCGPPRSVGAPCFELHECGDDAYCEFSESSGICVLDPASDTSCGDRRPCHGSQICHSGVCGAFDVCAVP